MRTLRDCRRSKESWINISSLTTLILYASISPVVPATRWGLPPVTKAGFGWHQRYCSFLSSDPTNRDIFSIRGGNSEDAPVDSKSTDTNADLSLEEKVQAAMIKLGISTPPSPGSSSQNEELQSTENAQCKDGVCPLPEKEATTDTPVVVEKEEDKQDPKVLADQIAAEMDVNPRIAMAAILATGTTQQSSDSISTGVTNDQRSYNMQAARDMIQHEKNIIQAIPQDSPEVQQLVSEGHADSYLVRRALAFSENNVDSARQLLLEDQAEEEEEEEDDDELGGGDDEQDDESPETKTKNDGPDFIQVNAGNFDPTALPATQKAQSASKPPKSVPKKSVVFKATAAQMQELVLESPVPVLLDIYADWCGPCKALSPVLEEMAVKAGGMFRLVKVNSDNERQVSSALEVTALPTVFGVRNGKIVHMFQGMPKSQDMMRNFMLGLFGAQAFSPPVTKEESEKYARLTTSLMRTAGSAAFSFSARERLTDRIHGKLQDLSMDSSMSDAQGAAQLLRTLLGNIVKHPTDPKYRKVNLENKVIASKIGTNPHALAVLKSVGFSRSGGGKEFILSKGKTIINVAPLAVARDCIEKWLKQNRSEHAAALRKQQDDGYRENQIQETQPQDMESDNVVVDVDRAARTKVDPESCTIKVRHDGKSKAEEIILNQNDSLNTVLEVLKIDSSKGEVQITCVAKRLVVKSTDRGAMEKTLLQHGLGPSVSLVIAKVGNPPSAKTSPDLKNRSRSRKIKKKKGSHTMQSVGIYSKDDNNKAELIDGGGGVWYEHDVSDDDNVEEETEKKEETDKNSPEDSNSMSLEEESEE